MVEQVLALLEPHQRKVIELTYFEGLTAGDRKEDRQLCVIGPAQLVSRAFEIAECRSWRTKKARATSASERKASAKGMLVEHPRTL